MWWLEPGITHWFASTSLWKTTCPDSGHLIQELSGVSRLNSVLIFGRTTSEIQFMSQSSPSCPASGRASTTLLCIVVEGVDGQVEPGQDGIATCPLHPR